jgi:hypothetical protein
MRGQHLMENPPDVANRGSRQVTEIVRTLRGSTQPTQLHLPNERRVVGLVSHPHAALCKLQTIIR